MSSKITGFTVQDFKRVKLVEIRPNENGVTILGGNNGQGKTSVLDAIAYALGGEAFRPSNVNNSESENNAYIKVEIDGLIVERAGKNGALKVTDARGMRGNQTLLNSIVSKFAIDLGAFMKASDSDKTKMLLDMFPELKQSLDALKTKDTEIRNERYDINRDVNRIQIMFENMPFFEGVPEEEIDINAIAGKLVEATNRRMELSAIESEAKSLEAEISAKTQHIDMSCKTLEAQRQISASMSSAHIQRMNELKSSLAREQEEYERLLAEHKKRIENIEQMIVDENADYPKRVKECETALASLENEINSLGPEIEGLKAKVADKHDEYIDKEREITDEIERIKAEQSSISEVNEKVRKNKERKELEERLASLKVESEAKSEELKKIAAERNGLLQQANLPLPELSIDESGMLLYKGQKWDCMSGSERLKVATAISMNTKPGCGFVLVDGLEAMDSKTIAEFNEYLVERNMQCIGTIVGDNSATVIIEDGQVKES
jgi:DNA repair exonuclease SbcCD ATPase subunit